MTSRERCHWTEEEKTKLEKISKYYTDNELAEIFGRSIIAIKSMKCRLGIVQNPTREKTIVPDGYKKCSKCKEILPSDKFYKNKSKYDGLQSECKDCCRESEVEKKFRKDKENKEEKINLYLQKHKDEILFCPSCNEEKTIQDYHIIYNKSGFVSRQCKACKARRTKKAKLKRTLNKGF